MSSTAGSTALHEALQAVWGVIATLPDDDPSFSDMSPQQRRAAHDLGMRCQDRLVRTLARLAVDMAHDGAELLDEQGLPQNYRGDSSG